jgi:hypothetical protein
MNDKFNDVSWGDENKSKKDLFLKIRKTTHFFMMAGCWGGVVGYICANNCHFPLYNTSILCMLHHYILPVTSLELRVASGVYAAVWRRVRTAPPQP